MSSAVICGKGEEKVEGKQERSTGVNSSLILEKYLAQNSAACSSVEPGGHSSFTSKFGFLSIEDSGLVNAANLLPKPPSQLPSPPGNEGNLACAV